MQLIDAVFSFVILTFLLFLFIPTKYELSYESDKVFEVLSEPIFIIVT